ncbi:DUF2339 domain-containing protein [Actinomycetospora termitidis]|uniref:DUF2339 domain-containing protein n=1 Tax=Actinomycetospora termitidis TaxID=3053470 RepID=A0ABT7MC00_9PSEU|nr:DUF2339 domain-containing protein [Actinomycetospora sp. Odt1-22]MDL5158184.1 DUF2339 domain-containing protein [Actinomycetospora sp. Odt1-22]
MTSADHTALLDRLDGELADLGARLSRVRSDLGALRSPVPTTGEVGPATHSPVGTGPVPTPPGGPPPGFRPWSPGAPAGPQPERPTPAPGTVAPAGLGAPGPGWSWPPAAPWRRPSDAPAAPTRPPMRLPRLTGARLLAVTGAGVTLLGIVLLLVLAASRGWFGPEARVGLGGLVGLGLVGAGLVLQRRRGGDGATADPGPVTLAATGITALYLTVAAAASLYDLLPPAVAVVLALAVAAGGLALADRWRRWGLALGVVVGVDVLVPSVLDRASPFLVVLLVVVLAAVLPVAARRTWPALVAVAVVAASLGAAVVAASVTLRSGPTGAEALQTAGAVAVLLVVGALAALVLVAASDRERTSTVVAGVALAAPVLPLLGIAATLARPWGAVLDVVAVLVLLGVGVVFERGARRVPATPALVTVVIAAAAVVALQAVPLALTGVAQGGTLLALAVVLAVLARRTARTDLLVVAGVFGVVGGIVALVRDLPVDVVVDGDVRSTGTLLAMAVVGVLLAAAAGTLLHAIAGAGLLHGRDRTAVIVGAFGLAGLYGAAGVVVTLALAVSPTRDGFLVGHVLVTISWTALALVLLVRGVASSLPRVLGGVLVVAAVAKLILFDLTALDGLARVAVFLGAGLVLLVAGTRYARLVSQAGAEEEPGTLASHGGDGAQRSSIHEQ